MPAVSTTTSKAQKLPKVRPKATPKVRATVPDAHETTRAKPEQQTGKVRMYAHPQRAAAQKVFRQQEKDAAKQTPAAKQKAFARIKVTPVASPDARDSTRSPAQQSHDRQVTARVVRESREKALAKRNRGSGVRAVKAAVNAVGKATATDTSREYEKEAAKRPGKGGGPLLAAVDARLVAAMGGLGGKPVRNALNDVAELTVTTPSSVAHLAETAVTHPKKLPGELAAPYVELAKHPVKTLQDKPVSTALMVQPVVRTPGHVAGRVARHRGKQTLERPPAELQGTALKEARHGSRDATVRAVQSSQDKGKPAPTMTAKDVQRRVDEHFDASKQESHRIIGEHVKAVKKATKGQPKDVRAAAIEQAREHAQQTAKDVAEERFAREFGANVRLSAGTVERETLHGARRQAVGRLDAAKIAEKAATAAHVAASQAFRTARARVRSSGKLTTLEFTRRDAQKDLVSAQKAHATARAGLGVAKGRAEVLSRSVSGRSTPGPGGAWAAGGHGVRLAQKGVDEAATALRAARDRVRTLDSDIAAEQQRLRKVDPLPQHQALTTAIHAKGQARTALATARTDAQAAAHAHINAKRAMTNSTLVRPTGEGRLFAHKQDAATVVKRLNQAAAAADDPMTFVLRQVGEDRYAAVPKVATERLAKHHTVGSSPATMAKVMRVSRGAFTNAVLPLSAKWLAGQGVEAGVRSVVAGAGPMDWLRMGKVVKELNKKKPGAGDELASRISGGQFGLTGPARDFAGGKSLAEEFAETPLAKPANVASAAGRTLPARAIKAGWKQYTRAVLDGINHVIESNARRAMAGQAIKNLGFQDLHINGLSEKAIEDAVNGLRGTHNQVALARAVDRMYGRYQKFSPEMRSLLLHWTPFLPWYLNSITFLFKVLPADHPVKASLLASANSAEEEWRKEHGLSLKAPHVPTFMLGSMPTADGKYRGLAHYTPFGIGADPVAASADLMLPQFLGPLKNAGGVDWKWQRLTHGGKHGKELNAGEKAVRALVTGLESQVPGVSQAGKISGLTPRYVDKDNPEDVKSPREVLKGYLPTTAMSGNVGSSSASGSAGASGRVKVPGVGSGRIKVPGVSGRIKVP